MSGDTLAEFSDIQVMEIVMEARKRPDDEGAKLIVRLGGDLLRARMLLTMREKMMATSKMYWISDAKEALAGKPGRLRTRVALAETHTDYLKLVASKTHNNVDTVAETVHGAGPKETNE